MLKPVFNIDILSGALIAIGFQGGHGTIAAIVFGSIMSNLSSGHGKDDMQMTKKEELIKVKRTSMTLQLAFIGTSIALGWLVLQSLKGIEGLLVKESPEGFIRFIPLFPVAMLAGLMILAGAGILYNLIIYFILAKKLFGRDWKIRGLGELGQSMGTTAICLILIKGKGRRSEAITRSFSYKQPFYEPIVGVGLITGLALPLIARFGPWPFLAGIVMLLLTVWIITRLVLK